MAYNLWEVFQLENDCSWDAEKSINGTETLPSCPQKLVVGPLTGLSDI